MHLDVPPPRDRAAKPRPPTTPEHARPRPPRFTAAHPLRVWVAGDSLAEVPGQGLERVARRRVDVVGVESRLSTGLARPDLYNWYTRIPAAPRELAPKVAVFSFGADDAHDYMAGVPKGRRSGRSAARRGAPSTGGASTASRASSTARGVYVVWLGLPIPAGPGFRHSFPIVNRILATVAKAHPRTSTYVDTWHLLDDAHGRYTAYLRIHGKLTLMRLPDGVHYTPAAGDLVAAQVLKQLRARFRF